jgi:hypothetical protein
MNFCHNCHSFSLAFSLFQIREDICTFHYAYKILFQNSISSMVFGVFPTYNYIADAMFQIVFTCFFRMKVLASITIFTVTKLIELALFDLIFFCFKLIIKLTGRPRA